MVNMFMVWEISSINSCYVHNGYTIEFSLFILVVLYFYMLEVVERSHISSQDGELVFVSSNSLGC
jgi:hypothetical protein